MAEERKFENKGRFDKNRNQDAHRVNDRIFAKEVRVIADGVEPAVYPIAKALEMAREMELDLVEISPNAVPPVCKLVDYKKFLYDQKKKQKEIKAKAQKVEVKEIRFGPNTDEHDFDFKVKHAIKFINEGSKVKAFVFFKGRAIVFKDRGEILLLRMAQALEDIAVVESMPKLEGKKMIMFLTPKKKK
ncbi:MAG: Translation initiation factor IF-3 [Flavobacteriales bacterium]|nr:Translation initiation factor IF-3 [Flavobacteriales bacterium]